MAEGAWNGQADSGIAAAGGGMHPTDQITRFGKCLLQLALSV